MNNERLMCAGGPLAGKEVTLHEGDRYVFTDADGSRYIYHRVRELPNGPSTLVIAERENIPKRAEESDV